MKRKMPKLPTLKLSIWMKILFVVLNGLIVLIALGLLITAFYVAKTVPPDFYSDLRRFGDEYYESLAYHCSWLVSIVLVMSMVGVMGIMNVFTKLKSLMEFYTLGMLLGAGLMIILSFDFYVMADYVSLQVASQMKMMILNNITYWKPMIQAQSTYRCCGIDDKVAIDVMTKLGFPDCCDSGSPKSDSISDRPSCVGKDIFNTFCDWIDVTRIVPQISTFGTYLMLYASYCLAIIVWTVVLNLLYIKKMQSSDGEKPWLAISSRNEANS